MIRIANCFRCGLPWDVAEGDVCLRCSLSTDYKKLQVENDKLRECVELSANQIVCISIAISECKNLDALSFLSGEYKKMADEKITMLRELKEGEE